MRLSEGGYRYEVVDGNLVVSPPPAHRHQIAASRLFQQLADGDGRVPDLAVVRAEAGTGPDPYPFAKPGEYAEA